METLSYSRHHFSNLILSLIKAAEGPRLARLPLERSEIKGRLETRLKEEVHRTRAWKFSWRQLDPVSVDIFDRLQLNRAILQAAFERLVTLNCILAATRFEFSVDGLVRPLTTMLENRSPQGCPENMVGFLAELATWARLISAQLPIPQPIAGEVEMSTSFLDNDGHLTPGAGRGAPGGRWDADPAAHTWDED